MIKIGLVTVLYKSDDVLTDFFLSLSLQDYTGYHLYLIDNSPSTQTDTLIDVLAEKYLKNGQQYTHIKNTENLGVAAANNQGINLSLNNNCSHVLLLNNDIEFFQPGLLKEMIDCAVEKDEDITVPKIFYHHTRTIWMAGGQLIKSKAYSTHVGLDQPDGDTFNTEKHFDYAPTCFMLISKKVFETVGLMDEKYFVYYDDTDFMIRAINAGFKVYYIPSLEVFHKVSSSTGGGESLFSIYYLNRNRIYFIKKNLSFPQKQLAYIYTIVTRIGRYAMYKKTERDKLLKACIDGFKL